MFRSPVEVDGINEIALISSTSGTTGQSKGNRNFEFLQITRFKPMFTKRNFI